MIAIAAAVGRLGTRDRLAVLRFGNSPVIIASRVPLSAGPLRPGWRTSGFYYERPLDPTRIQPGLAAWLPLQRSWSEVDVIIVDELFDG
jgi:hypothetical protein